MCCGACGKNLRKDNTSGYCYKHYHHSTSAQTSKSAWNARNTGYNREYYLRNTDSVRTRVAQYKKEHPEVWQAAQDRRRVRRAVAMDKMDRVLSVGYRSAISSDPCYYCGAPSAQTDHYFPLAKGGTDHWYNLVRACAFCNNVKNTQCGTKFLLRK